EAAQFFGDVEAVAVKTGISRNRAKLILSDEEATEQIRQAAKRAAERSEKAKPFKPLLPIEVKIEFTRADYCDNIDSRPDIERLDARTARMVSPTYQNFFF
ncbi:MAG: M55 family metallopeptidase, partial [Oscillospiraceae bacterium]|nr:M55 family metallopeptidase [Oscillospiraceae bacterium]